VPFFKVILDTVPLDPLHSFGVGKPESRHKRFPHECADSFFATDNFPNHLHLIAEPVQCQIFSFAANSSHRLNLSKFLPENIFFYFRVDALVRLTMIAVNLVLMSKQNLLVIKDSRLHARLKAAAARQQRKLWQVAEDAVRMWLAEREEKHAK